MKYFTLILVDLEDHSALARGRVIEHLSALYQISSEVVGLKLRAYPVRFPGHIEEQHRDQIASSLSKLGAIVEFEETEAPERLSAPIAPLVDTDAKQEVDLNEISLETFESLVDSTPAPKKLEDLLREFEDREETETDESDKTPPSTLSFDTDDSPSPEEPDTEDAPLPIDPTPMNFIFEEIEAGPDSIPELPESSSQQKTESTGIEFDLEDRVNLTPTEEAEPPAAGENSPPDTSHLAFTLDETTEVETSAPSKAPLRPEKPVDTSDFSLDREPEVEIEPEPQEEETDLTLGGGALGNEGEPVTKPEVESKPKLEPEEEAEPPTVLSVDTAIEEEDQKGDEIAPLEPGLDSFIEKHLEDDEGATDFDTGTPEQPPIIEKQKLRAWVYVVPTLLFAAAAVIWITGPSNEGGIRNVSLEDLDIGALLREQREIFQAEKELEESLKSLDIVTRRFWKGEVTHEETKTIVDAVTFRGEPKELSLEIFPPKPPDLTPQQIVDRVVAKPWIRRIVLEDATFKQTEESTGRWEFSGLAKTYYRHPSGAKRIFAKVSGHVIVQQEISTLSGNWVASAGVDEENTTVGNSFAEMTTAGDLRFLFRSTFSVPESSPPKEPAENTEHPKKKKEKTVKGPQ